MSVRGSVASGRPAGTVPAAAPSRAARLLPLAPLAELDQDERRRLFRRNAAYVIGGAVAFAVIYSLLSWLKYRAYMDARFDLGNMVQAVYNTAHGHFLQITTGELEAAADVAAGRARRPHPGAVRAALAGVAEPGDAARRPGRRGRHRRLAGVPARRAGHA